jgi:hypothetical protein
MSLNTLNSSHRKHINLTKKALLTYIYTWLKHFLKIKNKKDFSKADNIFSFSPSLAIEPRRKKRWREEGKLRGGGEQE